MLRTIGQLEDSSRDTTDSSKTVKRTPARKKPWKPTPKWMPFYTLRVRFSRTTSLLSFTTPNRSLNGRLPTYLGLLTTRGRPQLSPTSVAYLVAGQRTSELWTYWFSRTTSSQTFTPPKGPTNGHHPIRSGSPNTRDLPWLLSALSHTEMLVTELTANNGLPVPSAPEKRNGESGQTHFRRDLHPVERGQSPG